MTDSSYVHSPQISVRSSRGPRQWNYSSLTMASEALLLEFFQNERYKKNSSETKKHFQLEYESTKEKLRRKFSRFQPVRSHAGALTRRHRLTKITFMKLSRRTSLLPQLYSKFEITKPAPLSPFKMVSTVLMSADTLFIFVHFSFNSRINYTTSKQQKSHSERNFAIQ